MTLAPNLFVDKCVLAQVWETKALWHDAELCNTSHTDQEEHITHGGTKHWWRQEV